MTKYILCILLFTSFIISEAQIFWTGLGNGVSWSDANNWNPVGVPQSFHIVIIMSGDSIFANGDIEIRGLVMENTAVLNYSTTPSFEFLINGGPSTNGIQLKNQAKFYINGNVTINNIALSGLKMEGSNQLIIGNNGVLEIDQMGESGISGNLTSSVTNHGNISIGQYADDGIFLHSLNNYGTINVTGTGNNAAIIVGASSTNEGQINLGGPASIFPLAQFTNEANASFTTTGLLGVSGTFNNKGLFLSKSLNSGSLNIASNGEFHNWGQFSFNYSNTHNIELDGNAELINHESGVIENIDSAATAQEGVYAISLLAAGTSLSNDGEINLDLNNAREGIKLLNGGSLANGGILNIQNYYKTGISSVAISINKTTIENIKSAKLTIGEGGTAISKALIIGDENVVFNDQCADFIILDSLELTGTSGTEIFNAGYMQVDGIMKDAATEFNNTGALYLASTLLDNGLPSGYLNQFGNGGLIFSKNPLEITDGVAVNPLFAGFDNSAAPYLLNIEVKENGALVPAGDLDADNNFWKPNEAAIREDTVYVTYQLGECQVRVLTLPFYKNPVWDCNSAPAATVNFLGSIDTDWHNPDNWSNNEVPRACDKVIIPNGERCEIASGNEAEAKSILVETGGYFLAPPGIVGLFDAY